MGFDFLLRVLWDLVFGDLGLFFGCRSWVSGLEWLLGYGILWGVPGVSLILLSNGKW